MRPYDTTPGSSTAPSDQGWHLESLSIEALWARAGQGEGVRIVHLDAGIDAGHPSLSRCLKEVVFIDVDTPRATTALCDCVNGGLQHGTHAVAALAGDTFEGAALGVAPGAEIYFARVQPRTRACRCHQGPVARDESRELALALASGLLWAVDCEADIVSVSLGNLCKSGRCIKHHKDLFAPILALLHQRRILPIMAIGNTGPGAGLMPASLPGVLAVGASDRAGHEWASSSRWVWPNSPFVGRPDLLAPGVDIWTADPGGATFASGTSLSAPLVAGVAAILLNASSSKAKTAIVEAALIHTAKAPEHGTPHIRPLAALDALIQSERHFS